MISCTDSIGKNVSSILFQVLVCQKVTCAIRFDFPCLYYPADRSYEEFVNEKSIFMVKMKEIVYVT